jgi:NADH-quinone oxidoreductase subunit J
MVDLLFYVAAAVSVLCALGVVVSANPVQSVMMLLGSFTGIALIYLLAGFQFLAAIQILVYGGAIMVLFLFVVMLLNQGDPAVFAGEQSMLRKEQLAGGLAVAGSALAVLLVAVVRTDLPRPIFGYLWPEGGLDPLLGMAQAMFGPYVLAFEGASVLLLATAVGVMTLAKRQRGKPVAAASTSEEANA